MRRSKKFLRSGTDVPAVDFAYSDFGTPGTIQSDTREAALGIREVKFTNGVRLTLKQTDIDKERVLVQLSIDGGDMLNTKDSPLTTQMVSAIPVGGLGKHSQDELQSLLAGRTVGAGVASTAETFVSGATTTPLDLELQLQLMAAFLTDPHVDRESLISAKGTRAASTCE